MHSFNSDRDFRNIPSVAGPVGQAAVFSGSGHMSNARAHSTRVWARGWASWPLISKAGDAGLPKLSPCLLYFCYEEFHPLAQHHAGRTERGPPGGFLQKWECFLFLWAFNTLSLCLFFPKSFWAGSGQFTNRGPN